MEQDFENVPMSSTSTVSQTLARPFSFARLKSAPGQKVNHAQLIV